MMSAKSILTLQLNHRSATTLQHDIAQTSGNVIMSTPNSSVLSQVTRLQVAGGPGGLRE